MSADNTLKQQVTVTISFTAYVPTLTDEPEEGRDKVINYNDDVIDLLKGRYNNLEISAESEVVQ